ncbi:tissue factor pathway inhibitor 2 isoform X2 [Polypterus senegalus]|uniref:tissue factor pathway inhibitor 2 isoform X2 n=1 Tax=Polypterus senegalus TaxID=55291 RepID=UPI00196446CD|nr:tissue factor pathway inhibitor 2 isoform X2 [Polypterus senegalus]
MIHKPFPQKLCEPENRWVYKRSPERVDVQIAVFRALVQRFSKVISLSRIRMKKLLLLSLMFAVLLFYVTGKQISDNRDICLLPKDDGPCRAILSRYYYNRYTQQCEEFEYGGCEGNANNFETFEDCEKTCWMIKKVPKICRLEADEGPCRALLKKYFYNFTSMACEPFYYGGCYGNDNRFDNRASCLSFCSPQTEIPSICVGPADPGSCSASVSRYYYDVKLKACKEFTYSGCGGNSNNFPSAESCTSICKKGRMNNKMNLTTMKIRRKKLQNDN